MPQDSSLDGDEPTSVPSGIGGRVAGMQTKLHRWAVDEPECRFDDLYNFVCDPATLLTAWDRVAGNKGARTPGVDGQTVGYIQQHIGVPVFLDELRDQLRQRAWNPLPVRERSIPKPGGSGKVRRLGIPRVEDRVVQAALKLVLEPIFEADFEPVSYGFRPGRRAHDAIADIHLFGTQQYRWVLDADVEAAFDNLSHNAVMDRVRTRVKDKRVLVLVKAFLKAGILAEDGQFRDTYSGTPQGGILSPLLFNIALTVLDEHLMRPWRTGGAMATGARRQRHRARGLPTWRIVRYADDFVVLVHGSRSDVEALHEEIQSVLTTLGLRLSPAKTRIVHMADGFDFLGFHIQWRRKKGTRDKWHVYTFIADRPLRSLKDKIRALTPRSTQANPRDVLIRINQITRGWAHYFKHAVAKHTFNYLRHFAHMRVLRWMMRLHRWRWKDVRRWLRQPDGSWRQPHADGIELFNIAKVTVSRYRRRGSRIPNPWVGLNHA
ncbi:group II intron reverse transcriptase/maturase [Streptomyces sp. NPDC017964]|uniref:group II intron reverse transcriptase/maturase n=1 Tax=Streptomyces sp. NPDC017964 TaxID=3365022 RepID=UPI00378A5CE9